jgi:hypothetical protein
MVTHGDNMSEHQIVTLCMKSQVPEILVDKDISLMSTPFEIPMQILSIRVSSQFPQYTLQEYHKITLLLTIHAMNLKSSEQTA